MSESNQIKPIKVFLTGKKKSGKTHFFKSQFQQVDKSNEISFSYEPTIMAQTNKISYLNKTILITDKGGQRTFDTSLVFFQDKVDYILIFVNLLDSNENFEEYKTWIEKQKKFYTDRNKEDKLNIQRCVFVLNNFSFSDKCRSSDDSLVFAIRQKQINQCIENQLNQFEMNKDWNFGENRNQLIDFLSKF